MDFKIKFSLAFGGFRCIFLCYGKSIGKPIHFPCDEVYHRMGIYKEKKHPYYGKGMGTNFPGSPNLMVSLHFPMPWEIGGEAHAFPIR